MSGRLGAERLPVLDYFLAETLPPSRMVTGGNGRTDSRSTKAIAPAMRISSALAVPRLVLSPRSIPTNPTLKARRIAPKIMPRIPASCSMRLDVKLKHWIAPIEQMTPTIRITARRKLKN